MQTKKKKKYLIASWLIQLWSEKQAVMYLGVCMAKDWNKEDIYQSGQ